MSDLPQQINFKNEKEVRDALERWQASDLVDSAQTAEDVAALRAVVADMEKSKADELLKDKDNPEKWLELHRARRTLDQKTAELTGKEVVLSAEQNLFEVLLVLAVREVMHELIDFDPEEDGLDISEILENLDSPSDFFESEIEKDEDFTAYMDESSVRDITRVHDRFAHILTHCNNAYTLKRADYKIETVRMPTMGFLGKSLFPSLGTAVKKIESKTPCGKGRGDWVDMPTCFTLARTNDLLQEIKGRLSMYLEEREDADAARQRRRNLWRKIVSVFKK